MWLSVSIDLHCTKTYAIQVMLVETAPVVQQVTQGIEAHRASKDHGAAQDLTVTWDLGATQVNQDQVDQQVRTENL